VIWCILGVLFLRFTCPMDCSCMINFIEVPVCAQILGGRQHRTTPAGQILGGGVATPATPCSVDAYARRSPAPISLSLPCSSQWSNYNFWALGKHSLQALVHLRTSNTSSHRQSTALQNVSVYRVRHTNSETFTLSPHWVMIL